MDLRFRRLQEEKIEDEKGAILTKYTTKLLQESMDHALVRKVRSADADNASVHTYSGKWYQVDLLRRTCSCGRFQYHDIPCGHTGLVVIRSVRPEACPGLDYGR